MSLIATQPYVKVRREVTSITQQDIEQQRTLYLYKEKIVTKHREFLLSEVLDMTFRKIGEEGGLLYLHTNRGVFPYTVKSTPVQFIEAFRDQEK